MSSPLITDMQVVASFPPAALLGTVDPEGWTGQRPSKHRRGEESPIPALSSRALPLDPGP